MQIGALTVKITENINKINDLFEVGKDIKKMLVIIYIYLIQIKKIFLKTIMKFTKTVYL